jgi:LysR family transcriptional regulator, glycine cleavage system transcriptional activator
MSVSATARLVRPFGDDLAYDFAYYVTHRPDAANEPGVAAFKEWVLAQARG